MLPFVFMSIPYITSHILRQYEQFPVKDRVCGDHFEHPEFPRLSFHVRYLAARFFQDERHGCEIPNTAVQGDHPISAAGGCVARVVGHRAERAVHHLVPLACFEEPPEKVRAPRREARRTGPERAPDIFARRTIDALSVQVRALPRFRKKEFISRGNVYRREYDLAVMNEAHHDSIERRAESEIQGAVDGVYYPHVFFPRIMRTAFFGNDAVPRILFFYPCDEYFFREEVRLGDNVPNAFGLRVVHAVFSEPFQCSVSG